MQVACEVQMPGSGLGPCFVQASKESSSQGLGGLSRAWGGSELTVWPMLTIHKKSHNFWRF